MSIFGKGTELCHRLGKPSSSDKKKLATLFPGTSNTTDRKRSLGNPSFDPMLNRSQKKKAAMKIVGPVCKEVVLLNRYRQSLPKKKQRVQLNKKMIAGSSA